MNLPKLDLMFLTFRLRARESVVLPPFLGSTLRGAFGAALKRVFCFVPHGECARCWFFEACPYQYVFESPNLIPNAENHPKLRGQKNLPHPFVMIPPAIRPKNQPPSSREKPNFNDDFRENRFAAGDALEFSILLIGRATAFWAQTLVAIRLLAENGLGANRAPFELVEAFANDNRGQPVVIFDGDRKRVSARSVAPFSLDAAVRLRTEMLASEIGGGRGLLIEFLTPARIRIADALAPQIRFSGLLKKIAERIEFLARVHAFEHCDFRETVGGAATSLALGGNVKIYVYEQFSNRQNKKTAREVMTATLALGGRGEIEKYLPFLAAGEILHVGANTSDGFGRFALRLQD